MSRALWDLLVQGKVIRLEQENQVKALPGVSPETMVRFAIAGGHLDEDRLLSLLANRYALQTVDLKNESADLIDIFVPGLDFCALGAVPIRKTESHFFVALADPTRMKEVIERVQEATRKKVEILLTKFSELEEQLPRFALKRE